MQIRRLVDIYATHHWLMRLPTTRQKITSISSYTRLSPATVSRDRRWLNELCLRPPQSKKEFTERHAFLLLCEFVKAVKSLTPQCHVPMDFDIYDLSALALREANADNSGSYDEWQRRFNACIRAFWLRMFLSEITWRPSTTSH